MKKIGIGIDTGGTCTDGVIYDFAQKKILASAKALTTRQDLTVGICAVLDALPQELLQKADIVGLSTTLATNACVENKGGRAKLLFLGGDKSVVDKVGARYGFQNPEDIYYEDRITNLAGEILREPDWEKLSSTIEERFGDCDGVGVVEIYAMRNGGVLETGAKKRIEQALHIPVTCGHELYSDLGSLQRGASALLNARLIPVIHEFLAAVRASLDKRGVKAPIIIMRSDGTVMSEEFARSHPVETLLCGPAASVVGAAFTSGVEDGVIVDMGGTTTDIALVRGGMPIHADDGISIGQWKTYVKGLYVDTFGLGGDSAVRFRDNHLYLDGTRVVPLCVLAKEHPTVKEGLTALLEQPEVNYTRFLHEWYCLVKDISGNPRYSEEEKRFCAALQNGPLILADAARAVGKDVYTLNMKRLEEEGVVIRSGLTPTDIMHLKGDFGLYDREAASLGAACVARCLSVDPETLCDQVYDAIQKKLYCNIIRILLENNDPYYKKHGIGPDVQRLIETSWTHEGNGFLSTLFRTPLRLVGVGAPIHVFLPKVAKRLGTEAVIPDYAAVTNAVGAVAGDVSVKAVIQILPTELPDGEDGFMVYSGEGSCSFEALADAVEEAIRLGSEQVRRELRERGGREDLPLHHSVQEQTAEASTNSIYLGTIVSVWG